MAVKRRLLEVLAFAIDLEKPGDKIGQVRSTVGKYFGLDLGLVTVAVSGDVLRKGMVQRRVGRSDVLIEPLGQSLEPRRVKKIRVFKTVNTEVHIDPRIAVPVFRKYSHNSRKSPFLSSKGQMNNIAPDEYCYQRAAGGKPTRSGPYVLDLRQSAGSFLLKKCHECGIKQFCAASKRLATLDLAVLVVWKTISG